jgi:hypothetical protein
MPRRGTPGYVAPELIVEELPSAAITPRSVAVAVLDVDPGQPAAIRPQPVPITQAVDMFR